MLGEATALGSLPSPAHLIMGAGWDREVSLVADIWGAVYAICALQGAIHWTIKMLWIEFSSSALISHKKANTANKPYLVIHAAFGRITAECPELLLVDTQVK